jgi:hypothetical protein
MSLLSWLRSLLDRPQLTVARTAPLADPRIPDQLPDIPNGPQHLLRYSATQSGLRVEFDRWADSNPMPDAPETLTLFWDGQEVASRQWSAPIVEAELYLLLDQRHLQVDGEHHLHYNVELYNGNTAASAPYIVNIDTTPPELPEDSSLLFDNEVISKGVTDAYLQAHGDKLPATVPAWKNVEAGDTLIWYWGATPGSNDEAGHQTLTNADIGNPIHFPGTLIRNSGDGVRYARYTVQDRAGTPLQRSLPMPLQINATPIPPDFGAPYVKETGNTGASSTLDPQRAASGATLVIKPTVHFEATDSVEIYWDDPAGYGGYHSPVDVSGTLREVRVPRTNVAMKLGSQLPLYYVVTRNGTRLESTRHALTVSPPANLPNPQCDKISGNQLSLANMGTGATFTLGAWVLKDTSQFVTLYVSPAGDRDPSMRVMVGEAVPVPSPSGSMTLGKLTAAQLQAFAVPSALEIHAKVSADNQNSWFNFPHSPFTLVK